MDIILKQDVDLLGSKYDVVTVKDGYARNFLIPQGLAVAATKSNVKVNDEVIRQQAQGGQGQRGCGSHCIQARRPQPQARCQG